MHRWFAALLAASLSFPCGAFAQQTTPPSPPPASAPALPGAERATPDLTPPGTPGTPVPGQLDPAVREYIRREGDKAREEMREEMRSEVQAAQSARESLEVTSPGEGRAKLDFLQLNGYLRVRGDLFDNLDLHRAADPSGYYLFPRPLLAPDQHGTLTTANMRFRLEPTLNVSEQVRVLAQVDMLDNIVFGSTPEGLFTSTSGTQFPIGTWTQVPPASGVNADRNSIEVKRAWAEVQTPVGLLSFGRMPSSWGLGILSHAGAGIDDDYGDSVDRIQFALTPLNTPIGPLVLVPMYEIVATGVTSLNLRSPGRGIGQPFDRDQSDDARSIGVKIVRMDTDEEVKRKLDRGDASYAFGAWYQYKSQRFAFPQWASSTTVLSTGQANEAANDPVGPAVKRDASAHVFDVWARRLTKRLRLEAELTGIIGEIGNASNDPANPIGPVLLRQFGGAAQADWRFLDGKLSFGGEVGFASGDRNPGFGNQPGRTAAAVPGNIDGAQFRCDPVGTPGRVCDPVLDIRNFRFNPAYRVDLILWREILQGVTDAWYLKPTVKYEILEGLATQLSIIYSQAMYASSTPSTAHTPLGIELDVGVSYQSDDGFIAFVNYGLLEPLDGLRSPPGSVGVPDLTVGHAIRTGVAVKF
jgi:uncharacterized protein (TIGR04551 family)